jgi:hypothetical protein
LDNLEKRKNLFPLLGIEPQVFSFTAGSSLTLQHNHLVSTGLEVDVICGSKQEADAGPYIVWVGTLWHMSGGMVQLA